MRIEVPAELPRRADGVRLDRLSATSLGLLHRCPELWRRRYLARERPPLTAPQHLGICVDEAVSELWRARMEGRAVEVDALVEAFHARFARGPVEWRDIPAPSLRGRGEAALALYARTAPDLRPEAVQREFQLAMVPGLRWSLVGRMDLETAEAVIDLKVRARHLGEAQARASLQAGLYLAVRRAEGRPARFVFHSLRHGTNPDLREVATERDDRRLDGALARAALGARRMVDLAERYGPEGPWPLADPEAWSCSERFCPAWPSCPGGAGPE